MSGHGLGVGEFGNLLRVSFDLLETLGRYGGLEGRYVGLKGRQSFSSSLKPFACFLMMILSFFIQIIQRKNRSFEDSSAIFHQNQSKFNQNLLKINETSHILHQSSSNPRFSINFPTFLPPTPSQPSQKIQNFSPPQFYQENHLQWHLCVYFSEI
jgi:hypothetical protein